MTVEVGMAEFIEGSDKIKNGFMLRSPGLSKALRKG